MEDGRAQVDLGERVFRVTPRLAASGEEGLQRLRGELHHGVAFDETGPASFERQLPRREHTQLHDVFVTPPPPWHAGRKTIGIRHQGLAAQDLSKIRRALTAPCGR